MIAEALGEQNWVVWRDPEPHDGEAEALGFVEPVTGTAFEEARIFAEAQVGKRYDYAGVGAFLTRRDRTGAELQAEREERAVWFCSELDFVIAAKAWQPLYARLKPFECSVRDAWVSPVRVQIPNPLQK